MPNSVTAQSFNEYAQRIFLPYILSKLHQAMQLDLVWGRYDTDLYAVIAKYGKELRSGRWVVQ